MSNNAQPDIKIDRSRGSGKGGKVYYFIRPLADCINRSRKVGGFTYAEIQVKIDNCVRKWFYPKVILYHINGVTIGSNNKENALKEYWRVCEVENINKQFEVKQQP